MSRFAPGLALALAVTPVFAEEPVCEMRGAVAVPVLEAAKRAFLDTDFERFLDLGTALMQDKRDVLEGPLVRLKMIAPGGFESCQTIVQRRDAGGLVQEVTTFNIAGQSFPMSLYLQAAPIRGEWRITSLTFNSVLSSVLDELR